MEQIIHKGWLKWNAIAAGDEIEVKTGNLRVNAAGYYLVLLGKKKSTENDDFAQIVDFLKAYPISLKSTAWNEFGTNIASAVICLATNQKIKFSKLIFDDKQIEKVPSHKRKFIASVQTKKVFANMRRKEKEFSGKVTPLFETMLIQEQAEVDETVTKEREDIMERAATTASSLEAEQDNGNINMTQSMTTLNKSLP
ncbi:hypothetical protein Tco_1479842 [Tanacetum coccineum]